MPPGPEEDTELIMPANHVAIERQNVVASAQSAAIARISRLLVSMRMANEIGSKSKAIGNHLAGCKC